MSIRFVKDGGKSEVPGEHFGVGFVEGIERSPRELNGEPEWIEIVPHQHRSLRLRDAGVDEEEENREGRGRRKPEALEKRRERAGRGETLVA